MVTPKCDRENMIVLCEALESGAFPQITSRLRRQDGFCCAGVACQKSELGRWNDNNEYFIDGTEAPERYELPKAVIEWLGIPLRVIGASCIPVGKCYPTTGVNSVVSGLTAVGMNDDGKTFTEIAAAIRKYYKLPPRADN